MHSAAGMVNVSDPAPGRPVEIHVNPMIKIAMIGQRPRQMVGVFQVVLTT
jgi:hypothetical protein